MVRTDPSFNAVLLCGFFMPHTHHKIKLLSKIWMAPQTNTVGGCFTKNCLQTENLFLPETYEIQTFASVRTSLVSGGFTVCCICFLGWLTSPVGELWEVCTEAGAWLHPSFPGYCCLHRQGKKAARWSKALSGFIAYFEDQFCYNWHISLYLWSEINRCFSAFYNVLSQFFVYFLFITFVELINFLACLGLTIHSSLFTFMFA